jgi:hypothetical protein
MRNCTEQTVNSISNWAIGLQVSSHTFHLRLQLAELMEFRQTNSPNNLPVGRTIHMRSAFQVWTVLANLKVKLYVYGGP